MASLLFTPVSLQQRTDYARCWQATPQHSLDYSLANLWGWQEYFHLEWAFDSYGLCWIRQKAADDSWLFWAPLGDWHTVSWDEALSQIPQEQRAFIRVPDGLLNAWQTRLTLPYSSEEDRGQWEYLYSQQDLATLPGNRYHKKKNHVSGYIRNYGAPEYHPLDDAMVEDVLALQDDWCQWHECEESPSLRAENEAINRVLSHWNYFPGLSGGSLYIDGTMVAFSVGEDLGNGTLGVHFEKGVKGIKGVYQAINQEFSRSAGAGFQWINRAQDLDEEGLRQAKMGYAPTEFLKKYRVRFR